MRPAAWLLSTLCAAVLAPVAVRAEVYCYDFGSDQSALQPGFTRITPATLYAPGAAAGWAAPSALEVRDRAYEAYVDGAPPPCWTCPLSQDSLVGSSPTEFIMRVQPGRYLIWVLCGVSTPYRAQLFDFDITAGTQTRRVQFENSDQFRHVFLAANATGDEIRLRFAPRSLMAVASVALWQETDRERVRREIMQPLRQIIDDLPPAEAARWTLVQPADARPWPAITTADETRGYLLHQRHWAEVVYPQTPPLPEEMSPELRAFAAPGEYEPANFIVYPLRELTGAKVVVSDLQGPGAARLPATAVEVRRVRYLKVRPNYTILNQYRIAPDALMPLDPAQPLPARENTRYWLTIHVPEAATPGTYTGVVTFAPQGGAASRLPLTLRVLPIKLQEDPDRIYGIYYSDALDDWSRATDDASKAYYLQKSEWELADMVAHGTRNVTTTLWAAPEKPGEPGQFQFNFDLMQRKVEAWQRFGFRGPFVLGINAGGVYAKYTGQKLTGHSADAVAPPPEYGAEITRMCRAIEAERVRRGWPEFLYYPVDEPATGDGPIAFMTETLKAVQAAGVRTYVTADPTADGYSPLRPYVDVWCTQPFLPARDEILRDRAARRVDYWCYPNHVNGENDHTPVNGARMTYGFGFWRSGFTALIPWIYRYDIGDQWNYLSGSMSDFFNRTADDGRPIPVAMWEAYREGYDDYRYVYTCRRLIADASRRGGAAAATAREAQATLDYVWGQIRVQAKYQYTDLWEPREADVYRWMIAQQIMALSAAGAQ